MLVAQLVDEADHIHQPAFLGGPSAALAPFWFDSAVEIVGVEDNDGFGRLACTIGAGRCFIGDGCWCLTGNGRRRVGRRGCTP